MHRATMITPNLIIVLASLSFAAHFSAGGVVRAETRFVNCEPTRVFFYRHPGGGGERLHVYSCNVPARHLSHFCLRENIIQRCQVTWNDEISSVNTNGTPVELFADANYNGKCIRLTTNSIVNLKQFGFNDRVSSFKFGENTPRCTNVVLP